MALGTMTRADGLSDHANNAVYFDRVSFAGDDSYPTGGTTGFDALLQSLVGDGRAIVSVQPEDCDGHYPVYDPANGGTLKVYVCGGASTAMAEVANTTDLSGFTFNLMVISK